MFLQRPVLHRERRLSTGSVTYVLLRHESTTLSVSKRLETKSEVSLEKCGRGGCVRRNIEVLRVSQLVS